MSDTANRLSQEKSPYLLQHAHNPVDWYPWGTEAFAKAKAEDKPVFLSVGYSTCHWCHVMEEESFSNLAIAKLMNDGFVAIKVDREERPDLDSVYMRYVMATTGRGGWPMSVFLTPDQKPFYGGTYFPPEDRHGIPGFGSLLSSVADAWKNRREEIINSADSAVNFLKKQPGAISAAEPLNQEVLDIAASRWAASFDEVHGGFGSAPKFPRSHALSMLLRHWKKTNELSSLGIVEKTLQAMAQGGMNDQLGGGFHRYSTDAEWRLPHFEKMLYDQALLSWTYLEAYQITKNKFYADVARQTLDYVMAEMTSPEGGFYSAQDADSPDPKNPPIKKEGAFYVWAQAEIESILSKESAEIFIYVYGVKEGGNAIQDPHQEFDGLNVLHEAHSVTEAALFFKKSEQSVENSLLDSRKKMLAARKTRPIPFLDDKILTDWNGLMIASFSLASRVLDEPRYAVAANKAASFMVLTMKGKSGFLQHRYRQGSSGIGANLEDYAFFIFGLIHLFETTQEPRWLKESCVLADQMIDFFWDETAGGFFMAPLHAEVLIARPKEIYDGAVPSGNSVAALALFLLERFTGQRRYADFAEKTLASFSKSIAQDPTSYSQMLWAVDFALGPSEEVVIAASPDEASAKAMTREIYSRFIPNKIVLFHPMGPAGEAIELLAPFLKDQRAVEGKTTAYVCRDRACLAPATNLNALKAALDQNTNFKSSS